MISKEDIIWLAGYLEGEGCFTISTSYTKSKAIAYRILVISVDKDIIERASQLLVGRIRLTVSKQKNNPKLYYGTNISGHRAIGWMMTLYPLMGNRRKLRIREVISDWKSNNREYSMTKRAVDTRLKRSKLIKIITTNSVLVNPFDVTKSLEEN